MLLDLVTVARLKDVMNCSSLGQFSRCVFHMNPDGFEVSKKSRQGCVAHKSPVCEETVWVSKGRYPLVRVNFRFLDKVLAYKTVERFDDSVAKKVAIHGSVPRLDDAGSGAEFRSFA